ncbi:MmcQ/YjbR family DNA-binding protein [Vibrio sp. SCSIO 43137]|uniref:MmcQ/YjbR family DNA-binding protein n=1 Tax=Vibrio sp. SCSIO 43137 TaxID=3021011 RepID=UPI002FE2DF13
MNRFCLRIVVQLKSLVSLLLSYKGSTEEFPFGPETQVFKVKGKMFALIGRREGKDFINLKADPEDVPFLIEQFESISGGYHMNKRHWVTVTLDHSENEIVLEDLIAKSYQLVVSKLTKAQKLALSI